MYTIAQRIDYLKEHYSELFTREDRFFYKIMREFFFWFIMVIILLFNAMIIKSFIFPETYSLGKSSPMIWFALIAFNKTVLLRIFRNHVSKMYNFKYENILPGTMSGILFKLNGYILGALYILFLITAIPYLLHYPFDPIWAKSFYLFFLILFILNCVIIYLIYLDCKKIEADILQRMQSEK